MPELSTNLTACRAESMMTDRFQGEKQWGSDFEAMMLSEQQLVRAILKLARDSDEISQGETIQ